VVPFLIEIFPQLDAREKEAAVQALAGSEAGARKLAEGLASGSVKREEISAFIARQMRAYDHAEITSVVEKYWGRISSGQAADKLKEIEKWSKALSPKVLAKADLRKGREVFQATCFACHQLFGEGMKIGPDLTGSNRGELSYLLENIIDPSSLVGLDYQLHSIEKTDGQRVTGLLREKTSSALSIGMLGGTSVMIPVSEIKNHQVAETSMMPEGLLANLTEEQVRDLIGYLQSPTQVPLPVAGEILIGDDQIKVAEVNRGTIQQQSMTKFKADSWSAGTQLWWTDGQPGDRVVLQFESAAEGRYDIHAVFSKAHDYGTFRLKINGQPAIDSIDLFHRPDVITTGDVPAGAHLIKAGLNQLIIEMLEPNPAATPKNMFGLDHLRMVPAE
jgi:putative heme-binding domain-containing protein